MSEQVKTGRRIWPWLVALIVVIGLVMAAALGWVLRQPASGPRAMDVRTDRKAVAVWQRTLTPALADLNSIPAVPGLVPDGAASINRCSIDSGQLFDLSAGRSWTAPHRAGMKPTLGTARGFVQIVDYLSGSGWKIVKRSTNTGSVTTANPRYDTVDLRRPLHGTTGLLTIQVFNRGVDAYLSFRGAPKACHLKS